MTLYGGLLAFRCGTGDDRFRLRPFYRGWFWSGCLWSRRFGRLCRGDRLRCRLLICCCAFRLGRFYCCRRFFCRGFCSRLFRSRGFGRSSLGRGGSGSIHFCVGCQCIVGFSCCRGFRCRRLGGGLRLCNRSIGRHFSLRSWFRGSFHGGLFCHLFFGFCSGSFLVCRHDLPFFYDLYLQGDFIHLDISPVCQIGIDIQSICQDFGANIILIFCDGRR